MIEPQVMVCGRSRAAMAVSLPFITSAFTEISLLLCTDYRLIPNTVLCYTKFCVGEYF